MLLAVESGLQMSVSVTTRPKRSGETDGEDYIFVEPDAFNEMRDKGGLLEWALVFENFYGTPKAPIEKALGEGRDVLFDIDWQGAESLTKTVRKEDHPVTVFILPPSARALETRLRDRAQDTPEVVMRRMAGASNEIQHWDQYDYIVINENVERSLLELRAILAAERLKRTRRIGMGEFVRNIQAKL